MKTGAGIAWRPGCAEFPILFVIPGRRKGTSRTDEGEKERLSHAHEIALADFDAIMPQDAVGGGRVEIEIREGERAQELLALHGNAAVGPGREGDVLLVGALELRRLERFDVVDRLRQP